KGPTWAYDQVRWQSGIDAGQRKYDDPSQPSRLRIPSIRILLVLYCHQRTLYSATVDLSQSNETDRSFGSHIAVMPNSETDQLLIYLSFDLVTWFQFSSRSKFSSAFDPLINHRQKNDLDGTYQHSPDNDYRKRLFDLCTRP